MGVISTLIPRTHVIPGYANDVYSIGGEKLSAIKSIAVTITKTQMLAINTTPKSLLAALGAGRQFAVVSIHCAKASGAYTTGQTLTIQYTDASNTEAASIPSSAFTPSGTHREWADVAPASSVAVGSVSNPANAGLRATASAAFVGASGGAVTLTIRYVEVE